MVVAPKLYILVPATFYAQREKNNATIQKGGFVRLRYPVYFERARYVSAVFKLETKQKQKTFHFTKAKCQNFIGIWNSLSDVT